MVGLALYVKSPCLVSRTHFALSHLWVFIHVLSSSWNTFPKVSPPHPFSLSPSKIPFVPECLAWMSHHLGSLPSTLHQQVLWFQHTLTFLWVLTMVCSNHMLPLLLRAKEKLALKSGKSEPSPHGSLNAQHFLRAQLIQVHWHGPSFVHSEYRCSQLIFRLFQPKSWALENGLKS